MPIKTHRVEVLIKDSGLDLKEINSPAVSELSKAYIRVRYPDLSKQYFRTRERVEPLVDMAKEVYVWIRLKFKKA